MVSFQRSVVLFWGKVFLLCFVAGALVYGASIFFPFVSLDDHLLVVDNPWVRDFSLRSLRAMFTSYDPELYIPITFLSFQIDYLLGGGSPSLFHATNIILHSVNATLVAILLSRLLRSRALPIFLGLIFLLHPIQTEAVVWISARKDLLSSLFFLLSVLTYDVWLECKAKNFRLLSIAAFAFGLMAKVSIIGLPVILLLIDFLRGRSIRHSLLNKWPYLGLAILFGIIALVGKPQAAEAELLTIALLSLRSVMLSLQHIFVPVHLSVLYLAPEPISLLSAPYAISALILIALGVILFLMREWRTLTVGALFFLVMLAPSFLNLAKAEAFYAGSDRYVYLAMIGILCIIVFMILQVDLRSRMARVHSFLPASLALLCIVFFGARSTVESRHWRSDIALFENALSVAPSSHIALINLANAYRDQGDSARAMELYDHSQLVRPDARIDYNRGLLFEYLGDIDKAEEAYKAALVLGPAYSLALVNLGAIYYTKGDKPNAKAAFEAAARSAPHLARAQFNLGVIATEEGNVDEAIAYYERALQEDPQFLDAHINLSLLYFQTGNKEKALEHFHAASSIDPLHQHVRALEQLLGVKR